MATPEQHDDRESQPDPDAQHPGTADPEQSAADAAKDDLASDQPLPGLPGIGGLTASDTDDQ